MSKSAVAPRRQSPVAVEQNPLAGSRAEERARAREERESKRKQEKVRGTLCGARPGN
jgi:hypothetical protein